MDAIFINSKNSKPSEPYVLILKLTDKLDLRRVDKSITLSNVSIYYTWKNKKSSYNNNEFKRSAPICNDKFQLPDGHIPCQIFKIILSICLKSMEKIRIIHQ